MKILKLIPPLLTVMSIIGCGSFSGGKGQPELVISGRIEGSVFTNGKSTLKLSSRETVEYDPSEQVSFSLVMPDGSPVDDSLIDSSGATVVLTEGDGYYPSEYLFNTGKIGAWEGGTASFSLEKGDLELNRSNYPLADGNSGREWSCLGGDGHGNYYYNLEVRGVSYDGKPVATRTFRAHVYVYGYNYSGDAEKLYGKGGSPEIEADFMTLEERAGRVPEVKDEPVWTWIGAGDKPILCDSLADAFYISWPAGTQASDISVMDISIELAGRYGDRKELIPGKDFKVKSTSEETQISLTYRNWAFIPVYSTMSVQVKDVCEMFDIASVYVYEAQQGGGGVKHEGTVTAYSFYGLENLTSWEQVLAPAVYLLTIERDGKTSYYGQDLNGKGLLTGDPLEALVFDGAGLEDRDQQLIGNSAYVTLRMDMQTVSKIVDGKTLTFTKLYPGRGFPLSGGGGLLSPKECDQNLKAAPGYVIPWNTDNWITNEKWAWQKSVRTGWTGIEVTPYEGKYEWAVAKGEEMQFTAQEGGEPVEVSWSIAGSVASGTSVSRNGLLRVDENENAPFFAVSVVSKEGKRGAVTINVRSGE